MQHVLRFIISRFCDVGYHIQVRILVFLASFFIVYFHGFFFHSIFPPYSGRRRISLHAIFPPHFGLPGIFRHSIYPPNVALPRIFRHSIFPSYVGLHRISRAAPFTVSIGIESVEYVSEELHIYTC